MNGQGMRRVGDHRRRPHSVLPRLHRLRARVEPGHDDRRAAGAGRALRPRRASGSATSRSARSSSTRATGTSRASRRCRRGLAPETPAFDVQRACGTSLDAAISIGSKIATRADRARHRGRRGHASATCRSSIPSAYRSCCSTSARGTHARRSASSRGSKLRPRHLQARVPGVVEPRTGAVDGRACEIMAKEWHISRAGAGRARAREPSQRRRGVRAKASSTTRSSSTAA